MLAAFPEARKKPPWIRFAEKSRNSDEGWGIAENRDPGSALQCRENSSWLTARLSFQDEGFRTTSHAVADCLHQVEGIGADFLGGQILRSEDERALRICRSGRRQDTRLFCRGRFQQRFLHKKAAPVQSLGNNWVVLLTKRRGKDSTPPIELASETCGARAQAARKQRRESFALAGQPSGSQQEEKARASCNPQSSRPWHYRQFHRAPALLEILPGNNKQLRSAAYFCFSSRRRFSLRSGCLPYSFFCLDPHPRPPRRGKATRAG